jgi:hypothetical protein
MKAMYTITDLSIQFSNELATARRELENAEDAVDAAYAKYVEAESKSKEDFDMACDLYELASDKKSWIETKRDSLVIINHLLKQLEEEIENLEYAERELTIRH